MEQYKIEAILPQIGAPGSLEDYHAYLVTELTTGATQLVYSHNQLKIGYTYVYEKPNYILLDEYYESLEFPAGEGSEHKALDLYFRVNKQVLELQDSSVSPMPIYTYSIIDLTSGKETLLDTTQQLQEGVEYIENNQGFYLVAKSLTEKADDVVSDEKVSDTNKSEIPTPKFDDSNMYSMINALVTSDVAEEETEVTSKSIQQTIFDLKYKQIGYSEEILALNEEATATSNRMSGINKLVSVNTNTDATLVDILSDTQDKHTNPKILLELQEESYKHLVELSARVIKLQTLSLEAQKQILDLEISLANKQEANK